MLAVVIVNFRVDCSETLVKKSTLWFSVVVEITSDLGRTFTALSDNTRREILGRLLLAGEVQLSTLAEPFDMTQTAVSKHVRVLCEAGLVQVEKRGRTRYCRLDGTGLKSVAEWLADYEAFWTQQVENLARHFAEEGDR